MAYGHRDATEERIQDGRVSIQVGDGEFQEHHRLEATFFHGIKLATTQSVLKLHQKVFSKKSKDKAVHEIIIKDTGILLINNFFLQRQIPQFWLHMKFKTRKILQRGTISSRLSKIVNNCIFFNDKVMG